MRDVFVTQEIGDPSESVELKSNAFTVVNYDREHSETAKQCFFRVIESLMIKRDGRSKVLSG